MKIENEKRIADEKVRELVCYLNMCTMCAYIHALFLTLSHVCVSCVK